VGDSSITSGQDVVPNDQEEVRYALSYSCNTGKRCLCSIGVLGASGSVGQRFILLLADHPFLVLHAVGASSRSAGKKYKDAVKWKQASPMSKEIGELVVQECKTENFKDCDIVFSGLDSDVAGDIGMF
jgi:aspartate-semialdehyde dehydrogenase